jgi:hypothetical protein
MDAADSMPIPEFDLNGCLPAGLHECTLVEVEERFGRLVLAGPRATDRRVLLFERLRTLISELSRTRLNVTVIVDGSFVTQAAHPEDIDLIVSLPRSFDPLMELTAMETNLLDARYIRRHYQFDVRVVREGRPEYHEIVAFFEQVKGRPALRKGLLRLIP